LISDKVQKQPDRADTADCRTQARPSPNEAADSDAVADSLVELIRLVPRNSVPEKLGRVRMCATGDVASGCAWYRRCMMFSICLNRKVGIWKSRSTYIHVHVPTLCV
jgi:hypothetical protein